MSVITPYTHRARHLAHDAVSCRSSHTARPGAVGTGRVARSAVVVAAVIGYFGVRGLTDGSEATAMRNASWIQAVERSLHLGAAFPVAPPRLAASGMTDTVTQQSHAYRVLQPPAFTNQYAAMPSLHVGWNLLMTPAILAATRKVWLRVLAVALTVSMDATVVLTANHSTCWTPSRARPWHTSAGTRPGTSGPGPDAGRSPRPVPGHEPAQGRSGTGATPTRTGRTAGDLRERARSTPGNRTSRRPVPRRERAPRR